MDRIPATKAQLEHFLAEHIAVDPQATNARWLFDRLSALLSSIEEAGEIHCVAVVGEPPEAVPAEDDED